MMKTTAVLLLEALTPSLPTRYEAHPATILSGEANIRGFLKGLSLST